ncbi:MAG: peptidase M23 [Zetaproteobacteria bacterium]|nr:MAG: peptidase M23 [Zetaproteobacteria bacterium]
MPLVFAVIIKSMKKMYFFIFIVIFSYPSVFCNKLYAQSHEISNSSKFLFPLGCTQGIDCWAVNYVDVDGIEGDGQDFKCGPKTYDGHKGTDFALGSIVQMRSGVDVFAAANGRVQRIRDGQSDRLKTDEEIATMKENKKECGNGILIDHGNGLQSIYCHLREGSIIVKPKQKIRAGQKIAQVGQSGMAEFPHLHFGVMWEGGIIDPYTGELSTQGCGKMKERMWHIGLPMDYNPVAIFDGGFRSKSPDFEAIKRGAENPQTLSLGSAAFVFWVGFYNVEKGDKVILKVIDPDGNIFVQRNEVLAKNRARQYYYTGRKIGRVQLQSGTYAGHVRIERVNGVVREKEFRVSVR